MSVSAFKFPLLTWTSVILLGLEVTLMTSVFNLITSVKIAFLTKVASVVLGVRTLIYLLEGTQFNL